MVKRITNSSTGLRNVCIFPAKTRRKVANITSRGELGVISKKENKLNSWDFNNCRAFLEYMIQEKPDNAELVKAYIKLIEKKTV